MVELPIWELVGRLPILVDGEEDEPEGLMKAGLGEEKSDTGTLLYG